MIECKSFIGIERKLTVCFVKTWRDTLYILVFVTVVREIPKSWHSQGGTERLNASLALRCAKRRNLWDGNKGGGVNVHPPPVYYLPKGSFFGGGAAELESGR